MARPVGETSMTSLKVNGELRAIGADPDKPLLWVLREDLGLTGTKFGCGIGACGACTVHVNGAPVRSCSLPLNAAAGAEVVTIEGLAASAGVLDGALHPVQRAWIDVQAPQCGYCQSGMIMAAAALLRSTPRPTDAEIGAAIANLCRCGTYPRVRRAIRSLADRA
jgi:isoquinoline 1-oxidoreductase alpha subunit